MPRATVPGMNDLVVANKGLSWQARKVRMISTPPGARSEAAPEFSRCRAPGRTRQYGL